MSQTFGHLLTAELDRWLQAGKVASFWLRDDDAVEPSDALAMFLGQAERYEVPALLAVIPAQSGAALAGYLETRPLVSVAVHGWSHVNHAPPSDKKCELGRHRPAEVVLEELADGFSHLQTLHGDGFVPMLVPPWNRIAGDLLPRLAALGYRALSVYGAEKTAPLRLVNTHVDVIDWHGTRGGRDALILEKEIVARLQAIFGGDATVGILTHHLVHDAAVVDFLEALYAVTTAHAAARWIRIRDLI